MPSWCCGFCAALALNDEQQCIANSFPGEISVRRGISFWFIKHRWTVATQLVHRLLRFLYVFNMTQIRERTIYTIEEAASHAAQSVAYLLNDGASGKLEFFVCVPKDIQVMNVGMFDRRDQESSNSVMRTIKNHVYDQKPLRTVGIKLLMLSRSDCQGILAMGTFVQDEFSSAGKFDEQLMIQRVRPEKPPENKHGIGLSYSLPRYFATYIKQASPERGGQAASPERKSISLTANMLSVSAAVLSGYIKTQPLVAPAASILGELHNAAIELPSKEKKKKRSLSELSRVIKKLYLSLDVETRDEDDKVTWDLLLEMAKSKSALLRGVEAGEIKYETSSGGDGTLTYNLFLGRLATIRSNEKEK